MTGRRLVRRWGYPSRGTDHIGKTLLFAWPGLGDRPRALDLHDRSFILVRVSPGADFAYPPAGPAPARDTPKAHLQGSPAATVRKSDLHGISCAVGGSLSSVGGAWVVQVMLDSHSTLSSVYWAKSSPNTCR